MENERTLTPFTEWINPSGKFQLNLYDKKGNLINNIEERERMENKFNIGDRVKYESRWYSYAVLEFQLRTDGYYYKLECLIIGEPDIIWEHENNLELYIEEPRLVKLNVDNKEVPILIDIKEHYELKEENEELKELLDIAKATIQMISKLIWQL